MRLFPIVILLIFTFCSPPAAWSQNTAQKPAPIQVEADRMETYQDEGGVLFSGNVQASQGDLVINADEMTVLYARDALQQDGPVGQEPGLTRNIEKIQARGHVRIVQRDWVAAGEAMDFDATARVVILSGDAKAWQDQNMVSGDRILLYLDEGKSVVEGSSREGERVKAFIYPSAEEKKEPENR